MSSIISSIVTLASLLFIAETAQNEKTYVFIETPRTWNDAQNYCREYHTDLPTIESAVDQTNVLKAKPVTYGIWIGLHRVPWTWSDHSYSLFRNWQTGEPNNADLFQYCVTENNLHKWDDTDCQNENTFVCQEGDCSLQNTSLIKFVYIF